MDRHFNDTEMEKFVLGMAMLLMLLLAGLVILNSSNEKCLGGWHLLELPCQAPDDDYPH
jgi:hypothetical protein